MNNTTTERFAEKVDKCVVKNTKKTLRNLFNLYQALCSGLNLAQSQREAVEYMIEKVIREDQEVL